MSTTLNESRTAVYEAFIAAWTPTGHELTFDNEAFSPPVDVPWARLSVRQLASTQETLGRVGNRRFSRLAAAFAQIFVPIDEGTSIADNLATIARNAFEGTSLTGTTVRFQDVIVREIGPEGRWYNVTVEAQFEYDETR